MINTVHVKQEQLKNGSFKVGTGSEVILIIGSCRSIMYVNYLKMYNDMVGDKYTIHHLDPFNWNWDENENRIDYEAKIESLETNPYILDLLKSTKIYIHEYYNQFGMFNSSKENPKNIYQFGLSPEVDICVPNFNDIFIFFNDIVTFDKDMRELAQSDYHFAGKLSESTELAIKEMGLKNLEKFYDVCSKSSFPEMAELFKSNWKRARMIWTYNHVSILFTAEIFHLMEKKYLKFGITREQMNLMFSLDDMFKEPHTHLTQYDIDNYGFTFNDTIKPLAI